MKLNYEQEVMNKQLIKILVVVGTRPNFIKVTQFRHAAAKHGGIEVKIVHTGQHYDARMADVFFEQFNLMPDYFLNITAGSTNTQMAEVMLGLEEVIAEYRPDLLVVVGDVNSTFAAALTANKMGIKLAHVESGLRSFDRTMPEEFNRILTDEITDIFFVTEQSGMDNLLKEGKSKENIYFVGNTMIDAMVAFSEQIENSPVLSMLGVEPGQFVLMTMHRPATVDSREGLEKLIQLIMEVTAEYKIVFPIHPRTVKMLKDFGLMEQLVDNKKLVLTEPLDYFSFQKLIKECRFILTDSGGIQEESTFLQVPCLTLRPNTERPCTITLGTNELIPFDLPLILSKIRSIADGTYKKGSIPPLWDGHATDRIIEVIACKLVP